MIDIKVGGTIRGAPHVDCREAALNARKQRQLIGLAQSLAMQAMEFPSDQRQAVIELAVARIRMDYEQEHGADPSIVAQIRMLLDLTHALMRIIEECGGQIGHA